MASINKEEYKVGDVNKVAAFISAGLKTKRIEYSIPNGKKIRVMFVFHKKEIEFIESKYLSRDLHVDARLLIDTINEVKNIIRNAPNNLEKGNG